MKYTELNTLTEIAQAKDAGLKLEWRERHLNTWHPSTSKGISDILKYRIVEEEWEPEVDEMVIVVGYDGTEQGKRKFKFMDGDKYVCLIDIHHYFSWPEVKPIPKEKPVAREGWTYASALHTEPSPLNEVTQMIYVREIMGDE